MDWGQGGRISIIIIGFHGSRFRMNWVIGLFILGCMYVFFRAVITVAWIRRAGCLWVWISYLMYGLGWVVTCGVSVGAYWEDCYRVY
jgi:hypothetical protein